MKKNLSERVADAYSRYFPDAFIFALVLTILAIIFAIAFTDSGPIAVLGYWFEGIPMLFTFAFQLIITYAAALVLVDTPMMQNGIKKMSNIIKTPTAAYVSVSIFGAITSFIGWYIGPIVTALFARAVAQSVERVDYRLIAAISYASFTISLTGISGTIPLFVATEGALTDILGGLYPLTTTTFSTINIITAIAIVVSTTLVFYFVGRSKKEIVTFHDLAIDREIAATAEVEENTSEEQVEVKTFSDKINTFRPLLFILGFLGLVYLFYYFFQTGINGLNLNTVAFIAIVLGFLVHKNPMTYMHSFSRNLNATSSIALQFPIYGGIAAVLIESGLADALTEWIVSVSTTFTFPLFTFIMSGIINFFIPSAGSQFTATAGFIIPAAQDLGVEIPRAILAITYGDIWTNLIQPFWALLYYPILAVGTRLTVRDFLGYCLPILLVVGIIWGLGLTFLPL